MNARRLLLVCFVVSGFTSLAYQTVWMRLALARFGVNASVVASVLAVFMLGLAIGSFGAGRMLGALGRRFGLPPLRVYALAELVIAIGALAVPPLLDAARTALLALGPASGVTYSVASGIALAVILLPFCGAMGITFPSAVAAAEGKDPFSALYVANVAGAFLGAVVTPVVLIEALGFLGTSRVAAIGNVAIAAAAWVASRGAVPATPEAARHTAKREDSESRMRCAALFVTGLSTMGLEVVWMRTHPTFVGTFVYSFALIIASYLLATASGSFLYRRFGRRALGDKLGLLWPWLVAAAVVPFFSASIGLRGVGPIWRVVLGVAPLCVLLGIVTPLLVDREAGEDPGRVGRIYGINLLGCLVGPLLAGFVLLPAFGARWATVALIAPLAALAFTTPFARGGGWVGRIAAVAAGASLWFSTTLFEEQFPQRVVRHDHVATVVAASDGKTKHLFVNGVGMTELTTITKVMAHLPAAHLGTRAEPLDALVICFGMGTSFRSLASWDANVTAAELVPSVDAMFGFYFPDGPALFARTDRRYRVIHDDGRRFLDRTPERFDVITIDPPPPVEAAGSSLLYSKEFYRSARARMKAGAILQTWVPGGDQETIAAFVRAVTESFPSVRAFPSIYGHGVHVLASESPIPHTSAAALVAAMPPAAVRDLTEWVDVPAEQVFASMLAHEYRIAALLGSTPPITDDRPINEFFAMRRMRALSGR